VGSRLLVIENDPAAPAARLGEWLVNSGLTLTVLRPHAGDAIPAADDQFRTDGLLVLGGDIGAHDDPQAPWLPALRELLRAAVARELPTLGVCLGAQLLAAANGGRVAPNPGGPELGAQLVAKRAAAATDPLFGGLPITPDVLQWHFDAVVSLPPGAVQLASAPACEQQAFRLGRLAWGVQFHIETTPEIVAAWARADAARLEGYDLDLIVERAIEAHADIAAAWAPFAAAFAAAVQDPAAVPKSRGPQVATAAPITDPAAIRAALAAELSAARAPSAPTLLPDPGARPDLR
jgi:GMP synthase-like glutamine amidotransferase